MIRANALLVLLALALGAWTLPALAEAPHAKQEYRLREPGSPAPEGEEEEEEDAYEDEELEEEEEAITASETAQAAEPNAEGEATEEEVAEEEAEQGAPAEVANPAEGQTTSFVPPPRPVHAEGDYQFVLPPLLLLERGGGITTTAVFPGFYLRESPGSSELIIPPVYHQEGPNPFDVVFPIFWWYRGEGHHTWIAGPAWHHEDATSHDLGLAPLFMSGRHGANYYTLIPPLLGGAWGSETEDYLFAGILGYRLRNRDDEHWGIFPFLWVHNSPAEEYQFVPPVFFRWRNPELDRTLHIVGPVYHQQDRNESFFGFAGLLHHNEGPGFHSTTIPPLLFHYSESEDAFRLSTPLFFYAREGTTETMMSWLYQRYRGATEFDGTLPLWFHMNDPRDQSELTMVTPLAWHWSTPASENLAIVPLFLSLNEHGRSNLWLTPLVGQFVNHETHDETTFIAPTIQISRWHDGDAVNIHPLWYYESVPSHRFAVLNPVWWDFEQVDPHTRYTVAFPFYYRVAEGNTESQVTLPLLSYFRRRQWENGGRYEWEIHLSGLFDYGMRSEGEHWWRVLYGLIGWEHRIGHDRLWLLYMPIDFQNNAVPIVSEGTAPALSMPEPTVLSTEAIRF